MPSPIFPRTAMLLEGKVCPIAEFDALFATVMQTRQAADGYFVHAHPDGARILFVMSGFPYGVGLLSGDERAFVPVREFFTAYQRSPETPLSFFAADKRLLLGLIVCFQHKPAALFPESSTLDHILQGLEDRSGDGVLCLRSGEEWALGLFSKGRVVATYFPPAGHPLQMASIPREQLQAYAATMSPVAELYDETRIHPASDVSALPARPGGSLTQLFLPETETPPAAPAVEPEAAPVLVVEAGMAALTPPPAVLPEPEREPEPELAIEAPSPLPTWAPLAPAPETAATPDELAGPVEPRAEEGTTPAPVEPAPAVQAAKGPMPEIYLFVGERQIGTFSLASGEVTVGRTAGNTIVIDNPGVSRRHAVVRPEGARGIVEDLGSANGTFVNGQRVTRHELKDGDEITIVKHRLVFRVPKAGDAPGKPEPVADGQKTMFIDPASVAQAMAGGRQPGRPESLTPVLRPRLILPDLKKLQLEEQREITLGTGGDCDVQLAGMFVAKVHAKIVPQKEGQFKLIHLAGLAATRVNGDKISEHVLKHGDEIEIGKQKILFRLER